MAARDGGQGHDDLDAPQAIVDAMWNEIQGLLECILREALVIIAGRCNDDLLWRAVIKRRGETKRARSSSRKRSYHSDTRTTEVCITSGS